MIKSLNTPSEFCSTIDQHSPNCLIGVFQIRQLLGRIQKHNNVLYNEKRIALNLLSVEEESVGNVQLVNKSCFCVKLTNVQVVLPIILVIFSALS